MKFKVGDVCVIVATAIPEWASGMECTITGEEDWQHAMSGPVFAYRITLSNGVNATAVRSVLRLKRPPSWDKWIYDTRDVDTPNKQPEIVFDSWDVDATHLGEWKRRQPA